MIINRFKRYIAVILTAALVFSATACAGGSVQSVKIAPNAESGKDSVFNVASSAKQALDILNKAGSDLEKTQGENALTECGGNCSHCPTIIIPGVFQSHTFLANEDGSPAFDDEGNKIYGWPVSVDTKNIVKELVWPLAQSLFKQEDCGLSDKAAQVIEEVFALNESGLDGRPVNNIVAEKYLKSVALCTPEEKDFIYRTIPVNAYTDVVGEDHLYFFSYNSFGNNLDTAEELYEMIRLAIAETGHEKVNLMPISLGGTIANSLFEYHPDVYEMLNKVVYIIPALDGTRIIGDVYSGQLSTSDEMLYSELIPSLVEGYQGYLINVALRILPKQVVLDLLDKVLGTLTDKLLVNCTCMWALVPSGQYEATRDSLLSGEEHAEVRRQTDLYYQSQLDSDENILRLIDNGIEVFNIVDYGVPLYKITPSWSDCNADGVIHLESTSMGAYSLGYDTPLPDDYVQQNIHCNDPTHNHISPERTVDASTGLLPDHTFYFYNQHHEGTGRDDVIMKLAVELIAYDTIKDVYSCPDRFPQFNTGREARGFVRGTIPQARAVDQTTLSPEDAKELQEAIDEAVAVTDNTIVDYDAYVNAEKRLNAILVKIGVREPEKVDKLGPFKYTVCKLISDALIKYYGAKGFSD
ncbi:MAG: hypothetical protein GX824_09315 [Clostridiales bacterium]|nr:hypothetical protein [Clostridiales bacterium]